jgi:hypothetical protein
MYRGSRREITWDIKWQGECRISNAHQGISNVEGMRANTWALDIPCWTFDIFVPFGKYIYLIGDVKSSYTKKSQ